MIKNLPAIQKPQEMWVQSLCQEYPLEEGMDIHSSILAWRNIWTDEKVGYSHKELYTTEETSFQVSSFT